jgi:hypothetical protein
MQIRELSKPITSTRLNESLAKQFGYKLQLEQFSDVQLEDARNKLRTKISQLELEESYGNVNESPAYQKTRLMLDCINQEIMEREEGKCSSCHKDPCVCDDLEETMDDGKEEFVKKVKASKMKEKAKEHSVPESWINSAIKRIELNEADEVELAAELTTRYDLSESTANYIVYLAEGESEKAEVIMATKDMVDQITGWLEDVAAMKSEHLLELMDSIRENLGSDVASNYEQAVKPALEAIYQAIETSRQGLSGALAIVSGGEAPTMGSPAPGGMPGGMPPMGGEEPMGAEPGPEAALPPGGGEPGREKRESVDYSRRLGMLLNSKKK